jgi:DNA-binding GntR family transcriptional regulator
LKILSDDILSNRLSPGTPLTERTLAGRFGLSRTPIREVLWQLERDCLVESRPNYGVFVRKLTLKDIRDLFQLRVILEPVAAYLAAQHRPSEALEKLEQHFDKLAADSNPAPTPLLLAGAALHDALTHWADNGLLLNIYKMLRKQTTLVRNMMHERLDLETQSFNEHRSILEAVRLQNAHEARDRMRRHLQRTNSDILKWLGKSTHIKP